MAPRSYAPAALCGLLALGCATTTPPAPTVNPTTYNATNHRGGKEAHGAETTCCHENTGRGGLLVSRAGKSPELLRDDDHLDRRSPELVTHLRQIALVQVLPGRVHIGGSLSLQEPLDDAE